MDLRELAEGREPVSKSHMPCDSIYLSYFLKKKKKIIQTELVVPRVQEVGGGQGWNAVEETIKGNWDGGLCGTKQFCILIVVAAT